MFRIGLGLGLGFGLGFREKDLPQLPSTLGAQEMYQTHQELIRRQQNKPEKSYIELTPGTPVWAQHRQNTSWEPATVPLKEVEEAFLFKCWKDLIFIINGGGRCSQLLNSFPRQCHKV